MADKFLNDTLEEIKFKAKQCFWASRILIIKRATLTYPLIILLQIFGASIFTKSNLQNLFSTQSSILIEMIIGILIVLCTTLLGIFEKVGNFEARASKFKELSIEWDTLKDKIQLEKIEDEIEEDFFSLINAKKRELLSKEPNLPACTFIYSYWLPQPKNNSNCLHDEENTDSFEEFLKIARKRTPTPNNLLEDS